MCFFFKNNKQGIIFHDNCLLVADDSHEISYLIFFQKLDKLSQNLLPAAVVIGPLRVKNLLVRVDPQDHKLIFEFVVLNT